MTIWEDVIELTDNSSIVTPGREIHSTSPRPWVPKVLVAAVGQVRAGPTCPVSDSRPEESGGATSCELNYPANTMREKSNSMNLVNWREKKVCIHRSTKFNSFSVSLWRGGAMFAFSYCPSSWSVDSSSDQTETVYWLFKTFTSSDRNMWNTIADWLLLWYWE